MSRSHEAHRRRASPPSSPRARSAPSRRPRLTSTASPRSKAPFTHSCTSHPTAPSPRLPTSTVAARRASSCTRSPAFPSPSKTSSSPRACPPRRVPRSSRAGFRPTTPRSWPSCAPPGSSRSARPTWTSSRWARRPSTPPTAPRTTRGISSASPAAPAVARPPRSPPSRRRFALGSDTGGSIRQPAHVTGTVGLKPTYGGVSRYGAIALASSLDQIGPVSRTVLDSALLHDVIGGHDPRDSTSLTDAWPSFAEAVRNADVAGLRIGVITELQGDGFQPGVMERFREALDLLEGAGRDHHRGRPAERRARDRRLLPDHARRGLQQPGQVRLRALRPAGQPAGRRHRRRRDERHPRAGLRRRGEAPHHPRHLRALAPATTTPTTAAPRRCARSCSATSRPPSRTPTCSCRPRRPPRRSSWARRPAIRWRCTSTTSPPFRRTSRASPESRVPVGLAAEDGLPVGIQFLAPAREDARLYGVAAALEALLEQKWGHTLLSQAPDLSPSEMNATDEGAV